MSHSYKERSYFRSYLWREDNCSNSGDGRGGIGPSKTYFYYQKYNFGRDRHGGDFQKSQRRHTAPPIPLFRSMVYPVGASDGYIFGVAVGYCKGGVGPRIAQLNSEKVDCWIGGDYFVLSSSR